MIAIKTWTLVTLFACTAYGQRKPPNYQQNEMPATSFSCKDKIIGGYYADPETSCQMFHVCVSVAGLGVQDFRFLCPNNTAFDQENQICDDWYNIDCEAATLYYSDNFDLYRLGSGGVPSTSGKATPIPLGPSSASPVKIPQSKPRKPLSTPVNNAVSENDDDYYLQRSDVADSGQHQDLLRGSSSGNFFSNRNRGVENPDDYDDNRATFAAKDDVPKKNRKALIRKKPVAEITPAATTTTESLRWSTSTTTTTVRQPSYKPTTYRSKDRGRVNYKSYLDKQAKAEEYDIQKTVKPAAVQSTTFAPVNVQPYQSTSAATVNNVYQTTQVNNDFLRIAPHNNNNNNNNGFQSNRNYVAPNSNNNFQNNFQTVQLPQGFLPVNSVNQNFQNNANYHQQEFRGSDKNFPTAVENLNGQANFQSEKITTAAQNNYNPTTNAFQTAGTSTTQRYNTFSQSSTPYATVGNSFQQQQYSSQQPRLPTTTEHFSKDFRAKFNPYNSYHQRTNDEAGEILKTAPSTNLRPSDLNALLQPKPKSINATLSVGYSFNKADGGVAKSTVIVPAPTTQKPRPFTTQPAVTTSVFASTSDATIRTTSPAAARATSPAAIRTTSSSATTAAVASKSTNKKSTVNKDKDSSYDYAYYDDSNHNDYTDVVPEEFSRIQNGKE